MENTIPTEFQISKKNNETQKMYEFRSKLYKSIYDKTGDYMKAKVYSNIIINKLSLECEYPQDIDNLIKEFIPSNSDKTNIWAK